MTFFVAVIAGNQGWVFAPRMSFGARRVDTSGGGKVLASLLSVSATLLLLLLLPSFLVGGIVVFRSRGIWGLIWGQSFLHKRLVSRVPSRGSPRLGHGSGMVASRAALIHVPDKRGGQEADLCLSFDCFFDQLLPAIIFLSTLFHLSGNWSLEAISEYLNKSRFSRGSISIELHKDRLQMFKVGGPILYFLLLILTVSPNPIPDDVYKQPRVSKTLFEEGLKLIPRQRVFGGLVP